MKTRVFLPVILVTVIFGSCRSTNHKGSAFKDVGQNERMESDAQALLQKLLLKRSDTMAVGERYEGSNPLICHSGGKVSAQYFQWLEDADGLVRRLSWVKNDAPFLWVLKDSESGRALLAFYAEVGGSYTVDHSHGTKPPDHAKVKVSYLALYNVGGSARAPELKLRGYLGIPNQGICRWRVGSDFKLVPKLTPDVLLSEDSVLNSVGLDRTREAVNNSWVLVPPESPKLSFEQISNAAVRSGIRVDFFDGCGTGKPMRADYELSGDPTEDSISACSELPRRLDVVPK